MISPEEKIYSRLSKSPCNAKDDVPKKFAYVEPKTLGSRKSSLKNFLIGCAIALIIVLIAIVASVTLHGDLCKSFLLYAKSFGK